MILHSAFLILNFNLKVAHYYLSVNAMTRPMQVREDEVPYGEDC